MQRLLVYIRNRYQTSSAGYRYVLFQKMRLTSSSTRPSVLISTHPSISFPIKIQSGGLVNLIYLLLSN